MTPARDHQPASRSVILTGGSGFVGQHVLSALLGHGCTVIACEHRSPIPEPLRSRCAEIIGTQPDCIAAAARAADAMVDLAAYIPRDYDSPDEADKCLAANTLRPLGLARIAAEHRLRFVFASSANLYARDSSAASTETDPVFPTGRGAYYFASKLAGECYALTALAAAGGEALVLRIATPYGPGEPASKVIPTFLRLAAKGEPLKLADGGRPRFNFVHVDDVAACIAAAVHTGEAGVYNVASGESTSLFELSDAIAAALPESGVTRDIAAAGTGEPGGFQPVDIGKMRATWGLSPSRIEEGVLRYRRALEQEGTLR